MVVDKFAPDGLIRLVILSHLQRNAVVVESVLLRASLPLIHTNAIDLLTNLITRYVSVRSNVMIPLSWPVFFRPDIIFIYHLEVHVTCLQKAGLEKCHVIILTF